MNRLRNSINILRNARVFRLFSSTTKAKGDHGHEAGHGHDHGHHVTPRRKATWLLPAEDEHYYRGYTYREMRNLQGEQEAQVIRYFLGIMWFYVLYSFWKKPADFFGHATYPDTSKWTDEELGIPADDE